jgi:hypothetical protein
MCCPHPRLDSSEVGLSCCTARLVGIIGLSGMVPRDARARSSNCQVMPRKVRVFIYSAALLDLAFSKVWFHHLPTILLIKNGPA